MHNRSRYDKKSFLDIFIKLSKDELMPFLEKHRLDLEIINDEKLISNIIIHTVRSCLSSPVVRSQYVSYEEHKFQLQKSLDRDISTITSLINLLHPQITSMRSFAIASDLLTDISNMGKDFTGRNGYINPAYTHIKLALANGMRLTITNGAQLSSMLDHLEGKDRVSFVDEQEILWSELDACKAQEDATQAERHAQEPAQLPDEKGKEEVNGFIDQQTDAAEIQLTEKTRATLTSLPASPTLFRKNDNNDLPTSEPNRQPPRSNSL